MKLISKLLPPLAIMLLLGQSAVAGTSYYASGLLRSASIEPGTSATLGFQNATYFLESHFGLGEEFGWDLVENRAGKYHRRQTFQLTFRGRSVAEKLVRLHFDPYGALAVASSSLEASPEAYLDPPEPTWESTENVVKRRLVGSVEGFDGWLEVKKIYWFDPQASLLVPALEIRATYQDPKKEKGKLALRHFIADERTGQVLREKRVLRGATASQKVYQNSPFESGALSTQTLQNLTATTQLSSSRVHVQREQPTTQLKEVDPSTTIFGDTINTVPSDYNHGCTTDPCVNQSFDAVNVYYHLDTYRSFLATYLDAADMQLAPTFAYDPLRVIINTLSIDFDGDNRGDDETNNAAYIPQVCRSDNSIDHCLIFLRPASVGPNTICSAGTVDFYDLAREAIVIAHEYQHYVTDMMTGFVGGTSENPNVADALHEGISDYLAASYVTNLTGSSETLVGAYAFQNCAAIQRELSIVYPFAPSSGSEDPHISGLSWASALWKLRTDLGSGGAAKVDKILLLAMDMMPVSPSYNEAVEMLVAADSALYGGANVATIRTVMYVEAGLSGGQVYQDAATGVVDLGVRSCVGVHGGGAWPLGFSVSFISWLLSLCWVGRRLCRN